MGRGKWEEFKANYILFYLVNTKEPLQCAALLCVGIVEMKSETVSSLSELPGSWKRETSKQTNTIDKLE